MPQRFTGAPSYFSQVLHQDLVTFQFLKNSTLIHYVDNLLLCSTSKDRNRFIYYRASLVAQTVKRLPTMQETQVRSLGWGDPLEKEMAIHSSILAWKIPWTEDPVRLQSMGSQRVGHD